MPIVVRGFRLLTICARLGQDEVGSFSPRLPTAPSFLPPSSWAETLIVELRGTVKFCGADKEAIQIKRLPFPTPPVSSLYLRYVAATPSAAVSNPSLSLDVSSCNPYSSFRLVRSAVAFKSGCLSPGPFNTTQSTRQPHDGLSYVVCTRVTTEK